MNSSRTSRLPIRACAIALALAASAALTAGCYDTFHPYRAEVKVRFSGDPAPVVQGARFLVDGKVVIDSVTTPEWNAILDQGPHVFRLEKGCVDVQPADSVAVTLRGGHPLTIDFRCVLRCGLLTMNFHPQSEGLERGTKIFLDGTLVEDSLQAPTFNIVVEPGTHTVRYGAPDSCTTFDPDSVTLVIAPRDTPTLDVSVATVGSLTVESTPSGLPVFLDGAPRGTTPALIRCVTGHHDVKVSPPPSLGFSVTGDSLQSVDVPLGGSVELPFLFSYQALPQIRGMMLELYTYCLCPNCPKSDAALASLEADSSYQADAFCGAQIHINALGDPLYNANLEDSRMRYYAPDLFDHAPIAYFNGQGRYDGSSGDVLGAYKTRVDLTYGQTGKAALYWQNVRVDENNILRGDLRFVAVQDLSTYDRPELFVFYAKNGVTVDPPQNTLVALFDDVARKYGTWIDLRRRDVLAENSHLDLPVAFDLGEDNPRYTVPPDSLKLVGFVQDSTSKEIIQVREMWVNSQ